MKHTRHSEKRMQERGIPPLILQWLQDYGAAEYDDHGATIRYFDRRSRQTLARDVGQRVVKRLAEFLDAYSVGQQLYTLRSNVSSANSQIYNKKHELEEIEDQITHNEARLISDQTTTEDRVLLLAELKRLSERTGELEVEIEADRVEGPAPQQESTS